LINYIFTVNKYFYDCPGTRATVLLQYSLTKPFVLVVGGTFNTQWNSPQSSPASHPKRDRTQKSQDPRVWGLWNCLQGNLQAAWILKHNDILLNFAGNLFYVWITFLNAYYKVFQIKSSKAKKGFFRIIC